MLRRIVLLSSLGVLVGASAQAGVLTNATWFQTAQGVPLSRTLGQLNATGSSTGTSLAVNLSYPAFTTQFFVPKTPNGILDLAIEVKQGGAQAITATPGMANGTPGIPGTVAIMTAQHQTMGANASMFMVGANTLVNVPLSNGKAGQFAGTFLVLGQLHQITVDFFAWTLGSLMFTGLTSGGSPLPNVTAVGSWGLTPWNGGGSVMLVSPSKVSIDGSFAQRRTASFTKLVVSFLPEPGSLLLLGAALAALGFATRRGS